MIHIGAIWIEAALKAFLCQLRTVLYLLNYKGLRRGHHSQINKLIIFS